VDFVRLYFRTLTALFLRHNAPFTNHIALYTVDPFHKYNCNLLPPMPPNIPTKSPPKNWLDIKKLRLEWINTRMPLPGQDFLYRVAEEVLRRMGPDTYIVALAGIEDWGDVMENETFHTSIWHYNGAFDDCMEYGVAEVLHARDYETYKPIARKYFNFPGAMASSLTTCLLHERRECWKVLQKHPLFSYFKNAYHIKLCLVKFFNTRYTSLFADITGAHITLDSNGVYGSTTSLRLPDEYPEFSDVSNDFYTAKFRLGYQTEEQSKKEKEEARLDWRKMTDDMCFRWSCGSEEKLFVLNAMIWLRLLHAANPNQQSLKEMLVLLFGEEDIEDEDDDVKAEEKDDDAISDVSSCGGVKDAGDEDKNVKVASESDVKTFLGYGDSRTRPATNSEGLTWDGILEGVKAHYVC
ncbi:uncharacterized protein LY89DRAFT_763676, partial [Mollisia scopiformis]